MKSVLKLALSTSESTAIVYLACYRRHLHEGRPSRKCRIEEWRMMLPGESWPLHDEPVQTEWPTYAGKKLVKGYMTKPVWVECKSDNEYVEPCVRHVAMFEDGTIKITKGYVRLHGAD